MTCVRPVFLYASAPGDPNLDKFPLRRLIAYKLQAISYCRGLRQRRTYTNSRKFSQTEFIQWQISGISTRAKFFVTKLTTPFDRARRAEQKSFSDSDWLRNFGWGVQIGDVQSPDLRMNKSHSVHGIGPITAGKAFPQLAWAVFCSVTLLKFFYESFKKIS